MTTRTMCASVKGWPGVAEGTASFALVCLAPVGSGDITAAAMAGLVAASVFSAILAYATNLMPGKVVTFTGVSFGLMSGLGGICPAFSGWLADGTSMDSISGVGAWLPLPVVVTGFLPDMKEKKRISYINNDDAMHV